MSLTRQKIFDKVWERAGDKRKAQAEDGLCLYRNPDSKGPKGCFIGHILPDSDYIPEYDIPGSGLSWRTVFEAAGIAEADMVFASSIQFIHDSVQPDEWDGRLLEIASCHYLTVPNNGVRA